MQKIWIVIAFLLVGASGLPCLAEGTAMANKVAAVKRCLSLSVNLDRLTCYDQALGYIKHQTSPEFHSAQGFLRESKEASIRNTLSSNLRLGDRIYVRLSNRDLGLEFVATHEAVHTIIEGSSNAIDTLRAKANLHMAMRTVNTSPERGALEISCVGEITEFWLQWQTAINQPFDKVWFNESDNISRSQKRYYATEVEIGQRVVVLPRGLPSIELLTWLDEGKSDVFGVQAGRKSSPLVFSREDLKTMLHAQRRYCSWRW